MRTKAELAEQAKKNLNLSDEEFEKYKKAENCSLMWQEVAHDLSVSDRFSKLASMLSVDFLDLSNADQLSLMGFYNKKTGVMEPLGFEPREHTKENVLAFLNHINDKLDKDVSLWDMNYMIMSTSFNVISRPSDGSGYSFNVRKPEMSEPVAPEVVARPNVFKRITNSWFGWFKSEVNEYNDYVGRKARYDEELETYNKEKDQAKNLLGDKRSVINGRKELMRFRRKVRDEITNCKTIAEKLEEKALENDKKGITLEVITGRSYELIDRQPNYAELVKIPLYKSEKLPMEALAIIAGNSIESNKLVMDSSTQFSQSYTPKEGEVLTDEEMNLIHQVERHTVSTNIGAKIMDSVCNGNDTERMSERIVAVIDGRKKLNEAAREYEAGNKEPLASLLKDSLGSVFGALIDMSANFDYKEGQAFVELGTGLEKLFKDDPQLKEMVGAPEKDLTALFGAAKFLERIVNPASKRYECFVKNMSPGAENREAFVREMMYSSYIKQLARDQISKNTKRAQKEVNAEMTKHADTLRKFDDGSRKYAELVGMMEENIRSEIKGYPEMYFLFAKEPFDESKLISDFEKNIVNTKEYRELFELKDSELADFNFAVECDTLIEKQNRIIEVQEKALAAAKEAKEEQRQRRAEEYKKHINEMENEEVSPEVAEFRENAKMKQLAGELKMAKLKELENAPLEISKVLDPKAVYVKQQKMLGELIMTPEKYAFAKGKNKVQALEDNFKDILSKMIAAKQVDLYLEKNGDKLTKEQKDALCSQENISNRASKIYYSSQMNMLTDPKGNFGTPANLVKLAIGAEPALDPDAEPSTEPSKQSEAAILNLTEKFTAASKDDIKVDAVLDKLEKQAPHAEAEPQL